MRATEVARRTINAAPKGYDPSLHPLVLWRAPVREHGKRFYLVYGNHSMSRTWFTDHAAAEWQKRYHYKVSCVDLTTDQHVQELNKMTRNGVRVSYKTMLRHCEGLLDWAVNKGYSRRGPDLVLKKDWAVGYYRSTFQGEPCYYLQWSHIEFIWVREPTIEE